MNRFKTMLHTRGLEYITTGSQWRKLMPRFTEEFMNMIDYIIAHNLRVWIDPDCDPDGYLSALCMKMLFDAVSYTNYTVGRHSYKRHNISEGFATTLISEGYQAVILVDSSSGDLGILKSFVDAGIKTIVVDHHNCDYMFEDYPPEMIIVNPRIEMKYKKHSGEILYDALSACAICALLVDCYLKMRKKINVDPSIYIYGYVTLYSDCCDMSNLYNIAFAKRFRGMDAYMPQLLRIFSTQYTSLNRSFVAFHLIPRINALIRHEYFDLVWQLFYDLERLLEERPNLVSEIDTIYLKSKMFVNELVKTADIDQSHKNFCIATLTTHDIVARNYTGLVANQIATDTNKTVVCLFKMNEDTYAGSVRDPYSRDMLRIFKTLCKAEGHEPAFGIQLRVIDFDNLVDALDSLDEVFDQQTFQMMMLDWDNDGLTKDDIRSEILLMAEYNEFGTQGLPPAYGIKHVTKACKIYNGERKTDIYWNGFHIVALSAAVGVGDLLIITPTISASGFELITKTVGYGRR